MTRRSPRGFTLVELMVVVALIGIIAAVAVISMRRSRSTSDADAWASTLRNMVAQARARAISTKQVYMIDLRSTTTRATAQWCQATIDLTACSLGSCPTPPTTCPNSATGAENGDIVNSPADAITDSTLAGMDILLPNQTYATASHPTSSLPDQVYFGPTGVADAVLSNVVNTTVSGFTIYVRASNNLATGVTATSQNQMRRRVVIYGTSGRARVLDNWQ